MPHRRSYIASVGLIAMVLASSPAAQARDVAPLAPGARNPILPGYFADPSIIHYRGEWFLYATMDPWGGETLGLWRSRDFRNWTFSTPNWPTKSAATSPTSNDSKVWAPSVVRGRDGRFWMYVSVGSEVWVGVADHPAGPWRDAHGGTPLIPGNYRPGFHMIDAEAFIDDDGQAYLYWGSGLNWVNGHCFVVKLKPDMVSFDGEPRDVTPPHYFEGPFMVKRNGRYFLTYSWGNTTTDTYQIRYAIGDSPLGPFREPDDAPLLATDRRRGVISPGHHAIFRAGNADFVLYHRQSLPFAVGGPLVLRQVAVDRLHIVGGRIARVTPTNEGPDLAGAAPRRGVYRPVVLTASAESDRDHPAQAAGDDNFATSWRSGHGAAWLRADLGRITRIGATTIRPGYPAMPLRFTVSASIDGKHWRNVGAETTRSGSPITLPAAGHARYLRLSFPEGAEIFEWSFARR
jgi:arabinoxylan arabinofuranohydrolase